MNSTSGCSTLTVTYAVLSSAKPSVAAESLSSNRTLTSTRRGAPSPAVVDVLGTNAKRMDDRKAGSSKRTDQNERVLLVDQDVVGLPSMAALPWPLLQRTEVMMGFIATRTGSAGGAQQLYSLRSDNSPRSVHTRCTIERRACAVVAATGSPAAARRSTTG